jgi:hypothetical protein
MEVSDEVGWERSRLFRVFCACGLGARKRKKRRK